MADFQQALRWLAEGRAVGRDNEPRLYVTDQPSWLDMISTKWRLLDDEDTKPIDRSFWLIQARDLIRVGTPLAEWRTTFWTTTAFSEDPSHAIRFAREVDAMALMVSPLLRGASGLRAVRAREGRHGVYVDA